MVFFNNLVQFKTKYKINRLKTNFKKWNKFKEVLDYFELEGLNSVLIIIVIVIV